ncbi:MAG: helix-turn-helix transcriptional regulator [Pseudomonadota bacterium]
MSVSAPTFPAVCRHWRQYRKLSQLELALAANVSQRHVSWLETGRSQPSRQMVTRLAEAMNIPLRERNVLMRAAGFAPLYRESQLDEPAMAPVRDALQRMLRHHEPLPALVVDRYWNVHEQNQAAANVLALGGDVAALNATVGGGEHINLALLTLHPDGLRRYITNWNEAAPRFVQRLQHEAAATGDAALAARFEQFVDIAGPLEHVDSPADPLLPVLPLELDFGAQKLSLFSVISTFGTPQDITTDELRIEAFYPGDAATAAFFGLKS